MKRKREVPVKSEVENPLQISPLRRLERLANSPASESEALIHEGQKYSYSQLAEQVENRRYRLEQLLEQSDSSHLPLIVDRSLESYLTVLTCLVYELPFALIDADSPLARIRALLGLLHSPRAAWWPINFHLGGGVAEIVRSSDLHTSHFPSDSFVVTTSGSTGEPKGVELGFDHQRIRLNDELEEEGMDPSRQTTTMLPLHFVAGLNRVARMLLGGTLHVYDHNQMTITELLQSFRDTRITHLHLPAQLGRLIGQFGNARRIQLPEVRFLRLGGEGTRYETLQGIRKITGDDVVFHSRLGATEGNRAFAHRMTLGAIKEAGPVPVGLPTSRAQLVATDGHGEGVFELRVVGLIARGYINQPELTAERFGTTQDGQRFWKSGDLVRLEDDGLYYHFGRSDDVVKVRGMLASPSEATRVLLGIPEIRTAITLPVAHRGSTRLISHVEVPADSSIQMSDLVSALERELPSHLRPSLIQIHQAIPTTSRGKIDRAALNEWAKVNLT